MTHLKPTKKYKELKEVKPPLDSIKALSDEILRVMKKFYQEIVGKRIRNSIGDLEDAILQGKVWLTPDGFRGKFSARLSKELIDMGGKWNSRKKSWKVPTVPPHIIIAVATAEKSNEAQIKEMLERLVTSDVPKIDAAPLVRGTVFVLDKNIDKTTKFKDKADAITVGVDLDDQQKEQIIGKYSENMDKNIQGFSEDEVIALRKLIMKSSEEGVRYEEIVDQITERFKILPARAKFIARQETHLLSAEMKEQKYRKAGLMRYKWKTMNYPAGHRKGNVRPDHAHLDGTIHDWDNPPITNSETGATNHPGQDFNCIVGRAKIKFIGDPIKLFKRKYSGPIVKITDISGVCISVTPNHPVLTNRGWVFAKDIDESCKLVKSFGSYRDDILYNQVNDWDVMVTNNIFDFERIKLSSEWITGANIKFHGDNSVNEEVEVIFREGLLPDNAFESTLRKEVKNKILPDSDLAESEFPDLCSMDKFVKSCFSPCGSDMSFSSLIDPFGGTHSVPLKLLGLRLISDFNSTLNKPCPDNISGCFKLFRDFILANSGLVEGGNLLNVEVYSIPRSSDLFTTCSVFAVTHENSDDYVYNYETEGNIYLANGIVQGNCRCTAIIVID